MSNDTIENESPAGLPSIIRQGIRNYMKDVHTCLPGKIVEFNAQNQTAKVQLLIRRIFKGNNEKDIPALINVPVWQPKVSGFSITLPIKPDDECLVVFSERSIDNWFKSGGIQTPTDFRLHSYSDAICLVGMSSEPNVIQNYDVDNLQIRNSDNDLHISLKADKTIEIKAEGTTIIIENTKVTVNTEETIINASSKVTVDTPIAEFTTDVEIGGNLTVIGESTASDHISDGISGKTHKHGGVTSGTATSGPPQ